MPARTGTPSQVDASATSGSTSVTVPGDCNLVVAFWSHWDTNLLSTLSTLTLGGANMLTLSAQTAEGVVTDENGVGVAVLANPATGSQTLAWAWSAGAARSEGGELVLVYVTGGSASDPYRATGLDAATLTTNVTVTVSSVTTDLVLAFCQSFTPATPGLDGTVFINNAALNSQVYDVSEVTAGAGSTTVNMSGESYSSMAAISLKVAGSAVVSGTITAATTESDIVAGGKTVILTMSDTTLIAN